MSITYNDAIEEFLVYCSSVKGFSANTLAAYRSDLYRSRKFLNGRDIDKIQLTDITKFTDSKEEKSRSKASRARCVSTLRSFFAFCERELSEEVVDIRDLSIPKIPVGAAKALDEESIELILANFTQDDASQRDLAICETLYSTGIRISELQGLDTNDIDYEQRLIRVLGKGMKERVVPIGTKALRAIRHYHFEIRPNFTEKRKGASTNALFLSLRGGRLTRQAIYDIVIKAAKKVGLEKKVTPHVFRHSYATHLLQHGADIRVVQELLGHASLATTQRYTAVEIQRLQKLYDRAHPRSKARISH